MFRVALALVWAISTFAGQSSDPSVPGDVSGNLLQSLPIDAAQRSILEAKLAKRDYSGAEDLLADEAKRNPKSSAILLVLANVLFLDGRHLNCIVVLKKAEKLAPLDEKNRLLLALACVAAGHLNWARPEFEKLAELNPTNALYPYWLGRIAYRKTDINTAIADARTAVALDPSFMKAYDQLGLYYEAAGYSDEAISAFREAIRLNGQARTKSPWPMLNFGVLLTRLDRLDEAETQLRASLEADDSFPPAHYRLGQVLEKKQYLEEAKTELNRAAALDPTYPDPHYALARIYRRTGDPKASARELAAFQELRDTDKRKGIIRPD
jgi:tetratricopeptide (TPR) repeat protein